MTGDEMAKDQVQTTTPYAEAQRLFEEADGETRGVERMDVCPECGAPMNLRHEYRPPEQYHFTGTCSAEADHNLERYGYYSTEGTA